MLIPGLGHQGGRLSEIVKYGFNNEVGILVNCSRDILYASNGFDFSEAAGIAAEKIQQQMSKFLVNFN